MFEGTPKVTKRILQELKLTAERVTVCKDLSTWNPPFCTNVIGTVSTKRCINDVDEMSACTTRDATRTKLLHLKKFHPDRHQKKTIFHLFLSQFMIFLFRHILRNQQKIQHAINTSLVPDDLHPLVMFGAQM